MSVCDALEQARADIDCLLEQMSDGDDPSAFDLAAIERAASVLSDNIRPTLRDADSIGSSATYAERERPIMLGARGMERL